jgi:hypothetical protein
MGFSHRNTISHPSISISRQNKSISHPSKSISNLSHIILNQSNTITHHIYRIYAAAIILTRRKGSRAILFLAGVFHILLCACSSAGSKRINTGDDDPSMPELTEQVRYLDNMLYESSGLIYHKGRLWTINDSGGEPLLFGLDIETGKALQGIHIRNGENIDWEALAQDEKHVYICDIGNNHGRRSKLSIYKLAKDSIPSSGNASVTAEMIYYRYSGRPENNNPIRRSAYDCEAAFAFGDSIYLFTKDWETRTTTLYTCPKIPGTYDLKARVSFPANGLITGADISPDSSFVILCGYKDYVPFIWMLMDFNTADYSHGKSLRFDYPGYTNMQTEGIALASPERAYISCEMSQFPAGLYSLDLDPAIK